MGLTFSENRAKGEKIHFQHLKKYINKNSYRYLFIF